MTLVVVLLVAAVFVGGRSVQQVDAPEPDRVTVPTTDIPGALDESVSPAPSAQASPFPTKFSEATGTTLLIDTGNNAATALELDTGRRTEVALPGQRPGDQPFRLWPMGRSVVVGWGEIWSITPGTDEDVKQLGTATLFVPDADPNRIWLVDYEGGRIGEGPPTWTLIGPDGEVHHRAEGAEGHFAVRGVPEGLVLRDTDGLLSVYEPTTGQVSDYPEPSARYIAAARSDHVVWCGEACRTLVSDRSDGRTQMDGGTDGAFHPRSVWLSNNGEYLAALTPLLPDVDPTIVVYDVVTGERLHQSPPLSSGGSSGAWTDDDQFFYLANAVSQEIAAPDLLVGRWTPHLSGQVRIDVPTAQSGQSVVGQFVAYPSCALDGLFSGGSSQPSDSCPSPSD